MLYCWSHTTSQLNAVHIIQFHFFKMHVNVILPCWIVGYTQPASWMQSILSNSMSLRCMLMLSFHVALSVSHNMNYKLKAQSWKNCWIFFSRSWKFLWWSIVWGGFIWSKCPFRGWCDDCYYSCSRRDVPYWGNYSLCCLVVTNCLLHPHTHTHRAVKQFMYMAETV
jgi:hypothetical protein